MTETIINASAHEHADLIPVRMCNELVYCPRLFHLEHVQGVFRHSADTIEGKGQHERAKRRGSRLRVIDDEPAAASTIDDLFALLPRRLALVSERLGIRGERVLTRGCLGHAASSHERAVPARNPLFRTGRRDGGGSGQDADADVLEALGRHARLVEGHARGPGLLDAASIALGQVAELRAASRARAAR